MTHMSRFEEFHPLVNFLYFVCVIGFTTVLREPVSQGLAFLCLSAYVLLLKKRLSALTVFVVPVLLTALINPLFVHKGVTVLAFFPNGNPLTLESCLYGVSAGFTLAGILAAFSLFNAVITDEKFLYLFGRLSPALSLVVSMTLRFVPTFTQEAGHIHTARVCLVGANTNQKPSLFVKIKHGLTVLSILLTHTLEKAIDTADSMRSRGYGTTHRTAFTLFRLKKKDGFALFYLGFLGVYVLIGLLLGALQFDFYPFIHSAPFSGYRASLWCALLLLYAFPLCLAVWEVKKWNSTT